FKSFKATCTARSNSVPEYRSNFLKRIDQYSRLPQFNYHQSFRFTDGVTRGFVGFGITDDGRRADLIIGGIRDIERPYFADRYSATGDTAEDIAITDKETNILWIIGETDDIEGPIGGVNSADLTPYFADCKGIQHSPSIRSINADPSQDYDLISAREWSGDQTQFGLTLPGSSQSRQCLARG
ncbi:unnamed protein product, partial [Allacma fusca]